MVIVCTTVAKTRLRRVGWLAVVARVDRIEKTSVNVLYCCSLLLDDFCKPHEFNVGVSL